jgi:predicted transcriptional regulator
MSKITIATRIVPDWHQELNQIMIATGQSQSQVVEEAIGLYLKKSRRLKITSRLDALEQRVDKIAAIAIK